MKNEIDIWLAQVEHLVRKIDVDSLVVKSMPFGALIDSRTRQAYTPSIDDPDIAYGLAAAVKLAARQLKERTDAAPS